MAAAVLLKLLRKPSTGLRTITSFNIHSPSNIPIPLFSPTNPHVRTNPYNKTPNPLLGFLDREKIPSSHLSSQIYPSFPYGFLPNPISPTGFERSDADEAEDRRTTTVWADSVKKKRKRKMNKHKYKKLRKLLRRKT